MGTSAKKTYEKPQVESERIFETVGAGGDRWSGWGCTFVSVQEDPSCGSDFGGMELMDI